MCITKKEKERGHFYPLCQVIGIRGKQTSYEFYCPFLFLLYLLLRLQPRQYFSLFVIHNDLGIKYSSRNPHGYRYRRCSLKPLVLHSCYFYFCLDNPYVVCSWYHPPFLLSFTMVIGEYLNRCNLSPFCVVQVLSYVDDSPVYLKMYQFLHAISCSLKKGSLGQLPFSSVNPVHLSSSGRLFLHFA